MRQQLDPSKEPAEKGVLPRTSGRQCATMIFEERRRIRFFVGEVANSSGLVKRFAYGWKGDLI